MFTVISPDQYKQIPWKNGKGITTELAISENGTLDNFDWRLSIASVVENGDFSDFSGYWRNLVLISGNGITLKHSKDSNVQIDKLTQQLQISSFDGASKTYGGLCDGKIEDFNVITKIGSYHAKVRTYTSEKSFTINACELCFIYPLESTAFISTTDQIFNHALPAKHLLKITSPKASNINILASNIIVVELFV